MIFSSKGIHPSEKKVFATVALLRKELERASVIAGSQSTGSAIDSMINLIMLASVLSLAEELCRSGHG